MGDLNKLFASGQLGGSGPAPGDEKPAVALSAPALAVGVNLQKANGISNFDSKGFTGKDIFAAVEQGGHAVISWASKIKTNFMKDLMAKMHADLSEMNKSSWFSGGSSSSGSTSTASSSGSSGSTGSSGSASSGGGNSTAYRGGAGSRDLEVAVASARGANLHSMEGMISPAAPIHIDHTPSPPPPIVMAQAPLVDEPQRG